MRVNPRSGSEPSSRGGRAGRRDTYHHGSLRTVLIDACVRLVETDGVGAVSLRRVAREAGVSPGAPYHHFADRAALLSAICAQGFDLLADQLTASTRDAVGKDSAEAVARAVAAYVAFARARPGHFQLMFRPELSEPEKHPAVREAGDTALAILTELVEQLGVTDSRALALSLWALSHGLAALSIDGQLAHVSATWQTDPDELLARAVGQVRPWIGGP